MFEKEELIMCGGHGVCRVVDIVGNPIDKFDRKRKAGSRRTKKRYGRMIVIHW